MSKFFPLFLLFTSLNLLVSCGSDDDDSGSTRTPTAPQEEEVEARNFSTRISNNLLIEGDHCQGGETTTYDEETYTCETGQWLITLDNQNTCTDDGICTQIAVASIVATLRDDEGVPDPDYNYAVIDPVSPITDKQQEVIDDVYIRYDMNADTEAIKR